MPERLEKQSEQTGLAGYVQYFTEKYNRQEEGRTKQAMEEGREGEERRKGQAVDEEQKGQREEGRKGFSER